MFSDGINIRIDFVQVLPMELVEEILQYLSPKDLAAASAVNSAWREAVNSNKIWGQLCDQKGWKENFDPNFSHFYKAHKQFRKWAHSYDSFSPICEKRLLYNKHSCLLNNWRHGKFIVHKIQSSYKSLLLYEPVTCDGRYLVVAEMTKFSNNRTLAVWSLDGVPFQICNLTLPSSVKPVDSVAFDHGTIVFVQDWSIIVYKLVCFKFEFAYSLEDLKLLAPTSRLPHSMKQIVPFLKVTQDSIICIPSQSHSTVDFLPIFFWDRESGELKNKLNFESMYYQITSALWLGESCYLAVTNKKSKSYHIVEFGTKTASWEYFSQTVTNPIEQITGNDQYVLAVTKVSNCRAREFFSTRSETNSKELWLFDRATGSCLKKFKANGKSFQFVDNYLMFFESALLTVLNPLDPNIRSEFEVSGTISSIKACQQPNVLVVIKTGCYIEVWDWGLGSRLYTVTAETGYGTDVWCDDKRIITYQSIDSRIEYDNGIMVLGFW